MKKIALIAIGMLMLGSVLTFAQNTPTVEEQLSSAHSMIQILRSSRDQSEELVAQLHSRLQKALKEIEELKKKIAPEPKE